MRSGKDLVSGCLPPFQHRLNIVPTVFVPNLSLPSEKFRRSNPIKHPVPTDIEGKQLGIIFSMWL
jgi:hypothetical protein